ncbi:hypothetical protein SAM23877_6007 [Streptomyces ambofaciens ATCC 23877]|uniref:Uncharacterized protein n=1 Tax=Streptomyces ambofaciens (strain ATCC 23877 / 3486 / DSM 40053 / JCM 4204 / NBRC 12836 / NRRL B-2516) TaxID=278992 RepID=A0A0K2B1U2_STRA7|nr:hypothetical protein SAM23877_6007 [Streptomyces ambofaciens ATCC 23877]
MLGNRHVRVSGGPGHGVATRLPDRWRVLAMRTDKLANAYQAAPHLAAVLICGRR